MCLLNENVSIDRKDPLKVPIDPKMCLLKNEKVQIFSVFKCIHDINIYNHVT